MTWDNFHQSTNSSIYQSIYLIHYKLMKCGCKKNSFFSSSSQEENLFHPWILPILLWKRPLRVNEILQPWNSWITRIQINKKIVIFSLQEQVKWYTTLKNYIPWTSNLSCVLVDWSIKLKGGVKWQKENYV